MTKSSISSINKITAAAEMYFDGLTQEAIGAKLGVSRVRISQMQKSDTWQATIARLDNLKKKAEAEADRHQQLLYSSESDRRFEQARQMVQVSIATYSKLMSVINGALDEAIANPNKSEAIEQIRIAAPLIKAAIGLGQEVYGRNYDELEALKMLADAGWLPRSILKLANEETARLKSNLRQAFSGIFPDRPNDQGDRGITPETAAAVRAHLLGIQSPEPEEEEADVDFI